MNFTQCGNLECKSRPVIEEPPYTTWEERMPCPGCGSLSRTFVRTTMESARQVRQVDGTTLLLEKVDVLIPIQPNSVEVQPSQLDDPDLIGPLRLTILGAPADHEITVLFTGLAEGIDKPCLIELQDPWGNTLASGCGSTPADALFAIVNRMLPWNSSERHTD